MTFIKDNTSVPLVQEGPNTGADGTILTVDPVVSPRIKEATPHLPYLDGWRGCAILTLLAGHFAPVPWINMGRTGVDLFFVLSGRLMAEILFVRSFPLGEFFKRRFARIWPALLVFTLLVTILTERVTWLDAVKALTFTINYWRGDGFIHHVWSLCVEEHSYVVLALMALIVRRWKVDPFILCLSLALACVVNGALQVAFAEKYSYYDVYWRSDVRAASIFLAAAAYLYFLRRNMPMWFPIAMGLLGWMFQATVFPDVVKYSMGSACFACSVATMGGAKDWAVKLLSNRVLTIAGALSYSVYLWQQPFYESGENAKHKLLLLPLALICAVLSFYLVEKPSRKFIVGLGRKRKPLPAQPES